LLDVTGYWRSSDNFLKSIDNVGELPMRYYLL
jgi:hypothetical protein